MADSDSVGFGASAASGAVRIGTAEREQAAASLGEHFAAGRLEVDEYDDRVARAYAAKTAADLAVLFSDLPRPVPAQTPPPAPTARPGRSLLPVALLALLILAVVLVATTHFVPFFVFPVLFFIFLRGRRGWGQQYRGRPGRYHRM
ncbi:DUF1707 SHOCT-like domain-containing protein [Nocardia miyunensis]|uniref:DUF1707 SHOCT-like domain-containing protein n=1 Tax=Nocardia miyunensis TaxID=282684 RepID=UPI0008302117|nr:DUF1707 domain-containing protein [Nocardia miyunensis]